MAGGLVTLLAQEWLTPLEHTRHGRAMRLMAKCAVLGGGLMVPDEGTAFFRMALKTGVVDGIAGHQTGSSRSVRVMAVRAPNLALEDRMARGLVQLHPLLPVAGSAHLCLLHLRQHRIPSIMQSMTRRTGYILGFMRAPRPQNQMTALVARKALGVPFGRQCDGLGMEKNVGLCALRIVEMRGALSMASATAGYPAVGDRSVFRIPDVGNRVRTFFVMALQTSRFRSRKQLRATCHFTGSRPLRHGRVDKSKEENDGDGTRETQKPIERSAHPRPLPFFLFGPRTQIRIVGPIVNPQEIEQDVPFDCNSQRIQQLRETPSTL